ncbi:MAG: NADH-quinone oxidoreductase subunit C [Parvibaculum sp.]
MDESLQDLGDHIAGALANEVSSFSISYGELTLETKTDKINRVLKFLRDDTACQFTILVDICGVDYPTRQARFEVVYHLLSMRQNQRIRVRISADEDTQVPSATAIFPAAGWYEREAFDMYGILFSDHPDLRRILTDYGFTGHPLRKDFPVSGFTELRYDDELKRVAYEPVKLSQEYRNFDFESPWEAAEYLLPGDEKATPAGDKK